MSCLHNCAQCQLFPCSCTRNFWILSSGVNTLKGCWLDCEPDPLTGIQQQDPLNPIQLHDCFIVHAITHSRKARTDFDILFPALFPCEQDRFTRLVTWNPMDTRLVVDPITESDIFQSSLNRRIPVYTSGRDGARRSAVGRVTLPPHFAPKQQPRRCGCC